MNYVVCPHDGEHLKAAPGERTPGQQLLLRCPACARAFELAVGGIIEVTDEE